MVSLGGERVIPVAHKSLQSSVDIWQLPKCSFPANTRTVSSQLCNLSPKIYSNQLELLKRCLQVFHNLLGNYGRDLGEPLHQQLGAKEGEDASGTRIGV